MEYQNLDGKLRKYAPVFEFGLVLSLICLELLFPSRIPLSWQLVALVVLLAIIPYIPLIKRISYGDWEAELESMVRSADKTVQEPEGKTRTDVEERIDALRSYLEMHLAESPSYALVVLRRELEQTLIAIAEERGKEVDAQPVSALVEIYKDVEEFNQDLFNDITAVWEITSKATHGEPVEEDTAKRIIEIGIRVLTRLYQESERDVNRQPTQRPFE